MYMIHPFYLKIFFDSLVISSDFCAEGFSLNSSLLNYFKPVTIEYRFDLFHYTTPSIKLYYPEPFIASPTFVHEDIWFLHIVIYQYWLWFFFIFTIVFFFLVFITTVRWCNVRHFPTRETRGISRSKCGDLITSTVPITWAASIIIHESTDAVELADGTGTTEMAVGIRAYQWGWEYYYPRSLDFGFSKQRNPLLIGSSMDFEPLSKGLYTYNKFSWTLRADTAEVATRNPFFLSNKSLCSRKIIHSPLVNNLVFDYNSDIDYKAINFLVGSNVSDWSTRLFTRVRSGNFLPPSRVPFLFKNYFKSSILAEYDFYVGQDKLLFGNSFLNTSYSFIDRRLFSRIFRAVNFTNKINSLLLFSSTWLDNPALDLAQPLDFVSKSTTNLVYSNFINKVTSLRTLLTNFRLNHYYSLFLYTQQSLLPYLNHDAFINFKRAGVFEINDIDVNSRLNMLFSFKDLETDNMFTYDSQFPYFSMTDIHDYVNDLRLWYFSTKFFKNLHIGEYLSFIYLFNEFKVTTPFSIKPSELFLNRKGLGFRDWFGFFNKFEATAVPNLLVFGSPLAKYSLPFNVKLIPLSTEAFTNYRSSLYNFGDLVNLEFIKNHHFFSITTQDRFLSAFSFLPDLLDLNTYYQSLFKVFKSTFEDLRGSAFFFTLEGIANSEPFHHFTKPHFSITRFGSSINLYRPMYFYITHNPLKFDETGLWNFTLLNSPLSRASVSEAIRGSWIDWYTGRSLVIAKAVDLADFNLYGTKALTYNFIKPSTLSRVNFFESYFTKYLYTRRIALPIYLNLPYFFFNEVKASTIFCFVKDFFNLKSVQSLAFLCDLSLCFDSEFFFFNWTPLIPYLINWSGFRSFMHFGDLSVASFANNINLATRLLDIFTKRDYLRYYFLNSFSYSWTFFDSTYVERLALLNDFFDSHSTSHSTFSLKQELGYTEESKMFTAVKVSQYDSFRKGVANMVRIQADKAVAMPVDVRLQVLAVSKDIIHSWSIPSAGIKIDCIPGYSSHRVLFFLITGIYWGQCMEICGRFHHWMPIVVYFVKRDIFLMWCIHFVFNEKRFNKHFTNLTPSLDMVLSLPWSYWFRDPDLFVL